MVVSSIIFRVLLSVANGSKQPSCPPSKIQVSHMFLPDSIGKQKRPDRMMLSVKDERQASKACIFRGATLLDASASTLHTRTKPSMIYRPALRAVTPSCILGGATCHLGSACPRKSIQRRVSAALAPSAARWGYRGDVYSLFLIGLLYYSTPVFVCQEFLAFFSRTKWSPPLSRAICGDDTHLL